MPIVTCHHCGGVSQDPPCHVCGGSGQVEAVTVHCITQAYAAEINEKVDDLTDKVNDLTDKVNDIMTKCDDIFEKLHE